ncbi:hypothetical protein [Paraburkholderia xenovorans]|uniref:hypothetical protein n=1 Tax=Paraburkholderia xenovorans TaxID=36873 RepID=UPI0038BB3E7F
MSAVASSLHPATETMRVLTLEQDVRTASALPRAALKAIRRTGRPAVVSICADPSEYALGTRNQTTYQ